MRADESAFTRLLLDWFKSNKRLFPWRPAQSAYTIAVAEALLQKTAAINVCPVYEELITLFPTVETLAKAERETIVGLLQPLGLPRRAHLLYELAIEIVSKHQGRFPGTEPELRKLPGIGPYGAAAIACLAFGKPAPMIDVNVMRIFHRVFSTEFRPRNAPSKQLRDLALELMPPGEAAKFNLALLDFGALVCSSRAPKCDICPLSHLCDYALAQSAGQKA